MIDNNLIIELDGQQHFHNVSNWCDVEARQKCDVYKMQKAILNGYSIIRLLQSDVWNDKNNWEEKLSQVIKKYNVVTCIYLDNCAEYDQHKKLMQGDSDSLRSNHNQFSVK